MRKSPEYAVPEAVYSDPDNPFVTLYRDRLVMADGSERRYNRIVENGGRAGVVVMPMRGDAVALVEQYRYPLHADCLEFPRGFGEGGTALANAMRELHEETGLAPAASCFVELGALHPDSGLLTAVVNAFVARIPEGMSSRIEDVDEVARVRWLTRAEFDAAIARGLIRDALTLAATTIARAGGLW